MDLLELVFDVPVKDSFVYLSDSKAEAVPGRRAMAPFGRRDLLGYIIGRRRDLPAGVREQDLKAVRRVVDKEEVFGEEEVALARWMAGYYFCGLGEALAAMIPSGRRVEGAASVAGIAGISAEDGGVLALSGEQRRALDSILAPPGAGDRPRYLYGITGSGKTEVFLRAAEALLAQGKSVIYLVPEISLTHQAAEAIGKRFGGRAAALHSGMTPAARLAAWLRIKRGEALIVVGPRSAVFAPARNLALIIIDEEQDGSYKSGSAPRYHARQVAMRRCAVTGARLVMGSATPSCEAWSLMSRGAFIRLDLTRRLAGGKPPEIALVNLAGAEGCLTPALREEIHETARRGRQTILFLNRRGFAYFYHCRSCGYELTCRHCSVSLTWHKSRGRAICHYCGYSTTPPAVCPQCGSLEAGFSGFGTEMIEEEVRRTFPDLRVARADADSTARKGSLEETLHRFRSGEIDLLLGTQMVAKGLNFPGVRLVGVVLADTGLHLPDFRAAERVFSLVVQVAGRAGRYFPDGKVIVQTLRPHDPAIALSCALDVEGFYQAELRQREALAFPPNTRLIRFIFRSKDAAKADRAAARFAELARPLLPGDADALGPAECPLEAIAGSHRRQLLLRGRSMGALHAAAGAMLARYELVKDRAVYLEIDVDPVNVL